MSASVPAPSSKEWAGYTAPGRPAPALAAGAHLHQAVPGNHPHPGKWKVCPVGEKWGAFQPWAGSVYWLRLFDSFQLATEFVRDAVRKAARAT